MSKTRDSAGREIMGWLEGGYETLIAALADRIESSAARSTPARRVDRIAGYGGCATGSSSTARCGRSTRALHAAAAARAAAALAGAGRNRAPADHCRYLGVVCLILRTTRSVSPYYTLNITDRRDPADDRRRDDPRRRSRPRRRAPALRREVRRPVAPDLKRPAEDVQADYLRQARRSSRTFATTRSSTSSFSARRPSSRCTASAARARLPDMFPAPGLALASTAHVYPEIVNGQAVLGIADRVSAEILERLPAARAEAA